MPLSDTRLARLVEGGLVTGYEDMNTQLQPSSIDLRLGDEFRVPCVEGLALVPGVSDMDKYYSRIRVPGYYISPREFILGTTIERVDIPADHYAEVHGRSSFGRLGIMVHITAGVIDPGFVGQITLEIYNVSPHTIFLPDGARICQLVVHELQGVCARPYGSPGRKSKYQNQQGTTASKVEVTEGADQ